MTNLDSILKSRDIALLTKVHLVIAMIFPVVMYGCESWTVKKAAAAAAESLQSCPTLCDPIGGSPSGSPIPGILQPRTLEWVAISFSRRSSPPGDQTWVSHIADRCFTESPGKSIPSTLSYLWHVRVIVISYNPLYFNGIGCNCCTSDFIYLGSLSLFFSP